MIKQFCKIYMLEVVRYKGWLFATLVCPIMLDIMSIVIFKVAPKEVVGLLINNQFFPYILLLGILQFTFLTFIASLVEKKENGSFSFLKHTKMSFVEFYIGTGIGVLLIMNIFVIFEMIFFMILSHYTLLSSLKILGICNLLAFALYPLSYCIARLFRKVKTVNASLVPILLFLIFTVTMTSLFATLAYANPYDFYIYICWNPILYVFDSIQYILGMSNHTWLPIYVYAIILAAIFIVFSVIAKRVFSLDNTYE